LRRSQGFQRAPQHRRNRRLLALTLLFTLLLLAPIVGAALNLVRTSTPSIAQDHSIRMPETAYHALNGDGDAIFYAIKLEQAHVGIAKPNGDISQKLICFIGGTTTNCHFTAAAWTTDGFMAVITRQSDAYALLIYDPDNFTTSDPVASCAFAQTSHAVENSWSLTGNTPFWRYPRSGTTDGFAIITGDGYRSLAMPAVGDHEGTCTNLWTTNLGTEGLNPAQVAVASDTTWWLTAEALQNAVRKRSVSDGTNIASLTLDFRPRLAPAWGTNGQLLDAVHIVTCVAIDANTCTGTDGHSTLKKYFWSSGSASLNVTMHQNGTFNRHGVSTDSVHDRVFSWIDDSTLGDEEFGRVIDGAVATTLTGSCVIDLGANIRITAPPFYGGNVWSTTLDQQSLRLCETTAGEAGGGAGGGAGSGGEGGGETGGGGVIPPGEPGGGEGGEGGGEGEPPPAGETPTSGGIIAFLVNATSDFFAVGAEAAGFILGAAILGFMMWAGARRGQLPFAALSLIGGGVTWITGLLPLWIVLVIVLLGLAAAGRRVG